ncbi:methionine-tRNA ligase [Spizellomyces punctatus DAOM BR117]|uniref:methionine--tRNA ligase n=1 Tax=Spizellomyces punctatus (strain DAOM BR117) TaxID=645134 RepID=A0A0L0HEM3_SPIPD|nr:methionine-tRNA ligase [Spizellomyces punctatus DAOM BR117]KNC99910.1 methionine-tRNA ligase [Spizellomyces punctatus DAOM BR117]|eukprot:XP_016607950.1 methionine-tRNA ligase [Spizellomyces punctatus DAOM BR117]
MSTDGVKDGGPLPRVNNDVTIELKHHESLVLPKPDQRNVLITSALPYVNNVPHLGNIIGCVLSADVFARYCRLRGYNTLYICGTDEYGTATETKALEEGVSCQELCDKYHTIHKKTYEWFSCDFDYFGRTPTEKHTQITQKIFNAIDVKGLTVERTMTQLYCNHHNSFLADRFVEGTCPNCKYKDARGDQCDECGKLLDPTELINPHCKLDKTTPVPRETAHIFLDLGKSQAELEKWVEKSSVHGLWSQNTINITKAWLKEGLKERCITRDLKWGVPVPKDGFREKVFYVWFDACIGYPSITANYTDDWEKWWKNPEHVELFQFMGKDNVPFHTVVFPSTLLGTGEDWTLLHHINTTEYLQYEGGKFSKSRGIGVFGNHVVEVGVSVAVWRYYLLSNRPETGDSQFTWSGFVACNNNELLANLGNFVNRVVKFLNAKYERTIPSYSVTDEVEAKLIDDVNGLLKQYNEALEGVKLRLGLKLAMDISARGNLYLQDNRIDNKLFANARERCDTVISVAANLAYLIAALIYPYMPTTSESIFKQLRLPTRKITDTWSGKDIEAGHVIGEAEYLFSIIKPEKADEWRRKYGGNQADSDAGVSKTSKRKAAKAKAAAAGLSEAPAGVVKTPEIVELEEQIKLAGDEVRKLKTEKADAEVVKVVVDKLLDYKKKLAEVIEGLQKL